MRLTISRARSTRLLIDVAAAAIVAMIFLLMPWGAVRANRITTFPGNPASEAPGIELTPVAPSAGLPAGSGDDWKAKKDENGISVAVEGEAQTPDGPAKVTLSFACFDGREAMSSIMFTVQGANNMKGFPFDAFEGPDAPAANLPLIVFTVHRAAGDVIAKTGCSGFYGSKDVPDDAFTFEIASVLKVRQRAVARVSNALIQGSTSLSIKIIGYKQPKKTVEATFSTTGASAALGQVMKRCHGV